MSRAGATLVVNADDLGMCEATTDGIVRAHLDGVVTSTSLIVTTPALDHAVEALRGCPRLGVGLHFSLSAGRPLTPAERIPLLVDAEGRFATRFSSLLAMLAGRRRDELLQQIDLELAAQLERIASCGIRPDHIDGEPGSTVTPRSAKVSTAVTGSNRCTSSTVAPTDRPRLSETFSPKMWNSGSTV